MHIQQIKIKQANETKPNSELIDLFLDLFLFLYDMLSFLRQKFAHLLLSFNYQDGEILLNILHCSNAFHIYSYWQSIFKLG